MLANDKLLCLCVYCYNCVVKNRHYGLPQNYEIARNYLHWVIHVKISLMGQNIYNSDFEVENHDDMHGLLHDAFGIAYILMCWKEMKFNVLILTLTIH